MIVERIQINKRKRIIRVHRQKGGPLEIEIDDKLIIYLNRLDKTYLSSRKINFEDFVKKLRRRNRVRSIWVSKIVPGEFGLKQLTLEINT